MNDTGGRTCNIVYEIKRRKICLDTGFSPFLIEGGK